MIDKRLIEPVNYSTTQRFLKRYIKVTILRYKCLISLQICPETPQKLSPLTIIHSNMYWSLDYVVQQYALQWSGEGAAIFQQRGPGPSKKKVHSTHVQFDETIQPNKSMTRIHYALALVHIRLRQQPVTSMWTCTCTQCTYLNYHQIDPDFLHWWPPRVTGSYSTALY